MLMDSPSSPNWDGMPHGTGVSNPVEKMVSKKWALEQRYRAKLAELLAAQESIEDLIEGLETPTERDLMRYHYIDGLKWEDVCVRINYSWRQTHRIHSAILDKLTDAEMARRGT